MELPKAGLGVSGLKVLAVAVMVGLLAAPAFWFFSDDDDDGGDRRNARPLAGVSSWHYQLTDVEPDKMAAVDADLIVTELSSLGDGEVSRAEEVRRLKVRSDGGKRLVLAYFSIGEAESYRFYWKPEWSSGSAPDWLGPENCAWPRNYMVKYWMAGWKRIIFRGEGSYLARVLAAGFDGVYLDRVDVYSNFEEQRSSAKEDMIEFVSEIARAGRRANPGFIVVAQNAEDLLEEDAYRGVIDGLGKEDLLYGQNGTNTRNPERAIKESLSQIRRLLDDRKTVLGVEYVTEPDLIASSGKELRALGIVATNAHRTLDGRPPEEPRAESSFKYGTPEWIATQCRNKPHW